MAALPTRAGSCAETAQAAQTAGGSLTYLAASQVDALDPGQTYDTFGYTVSSAVHRTLYSFAPDATTPEPDLAAAAPAVSSDRRTITVVE